MSIRHTESLAGGMSAPSVCAAIGAGRLCASSDGNTHASTNAADLLGAEFDTTPVLETQNERQIQTQSKVPCKHQASTLLFIRLLTNGCIDSTVFSRDPTILVLLLDHSAQFDAQGGHQSSTLLWKDSG